MHQGIMSTDKLTLPQAGTGNSGESRPAMAGRPMDSGGDNQPTRTTHRSLSDDEELSPWRPMPKKLSTTTSPPWSNKQAETATQSGTPLNRSICIDLCWDEDEARSIKKRKRTQGKSENTNNDPKEADHKKLKKVKDLIKKIEEVSRELTKHVANNNNTKKEIKESVSILRARSSQLNTADMWALINSLTFNQGHIEEVDSYGTETAEMSTQTENSARTLSEPPETREIACQTNLDEEEEASDIRLNFDHCHDSQYLQNLMKLEWPIQTYHKTELATGNPINLPIVEDIAILPFQAEAQLDAGIYKMAKTRFPELMYLEEDTEDGEITYITQTTRMMKNNKKTEKHRYVFKRTLKDNHPTSIITAVENLAQVMISENRETVAIPLVSNLDAECMRKLAEIALAKTSVKAIIYSPERSRMNSIAPNNKPKKPSPATGSRTYFVKGNGAKYSDMLKTIKEEVHRKNIGTDIKLIRETKEGNLLLTLGKQTTDDVELEKTLKNSFGTDRVRSNALSKRKIFHVKNIDGLTSKDEIINAIKHATNLDSDSFEVTNVRPSYGFCQIATVRATELAANRLTTLKTIPIGITRCHIIERQDARRCRRCWGYDHLEQECTGTDRRNLCYKCVKEGHSPKECKNTAYCPHCEKDGHSAGAKECPHFRRAAGLRPIRNMALPSGPDKNSRSLQ